MFELSTIQAMPPEHRHGTFRYLFTIWFGCNMSLLTVITGALATTTFGLGFVSGCCAIVLGLLVGTVFMALHAAQGPQLGLPQMVQTRGQFGAVGVMLALAAVIPMYVGFIASNLVLGAQSIHSEMGGIGIDTGILLLGSAGVAVAVFGYDAIHAVSGLVTVATGLALFGMGALPLTAGLPKSFFGSGAFTWPNFVGTFSLAALRALSYAPYVSDYSRYMLKDAGIGDAFWATYLGNFCGSLLPMVLGAALGISLGAGSDLVAGFTRVAEQLAVPVIVVFSIGLTCGTAMNLYSCVLATLTAVQTCTRHVSPGPVSRTCVCLLIFCVAGTAAIRGQQSWLRPGILLRGASADGDIEAAAQLIMQPRQVIRRRLGDTASPRNTSTAWLSRRISSSSSRPTCAPTFVFGTVVILSTIKRHVARRPLRSFGCTGRRNRGASVSSVVKAQIVMESVASKLSS